MSIAVTVILGLLLAGVVVPVAMLLAPESLRGNWMAVVLAIGCLAVVTYLRRGSTRQ
jgi:hypothetical protein